MAVLIRFRSGESGPFEAWAVDVAAGRILPAEEDRAELQGIVATLSPAGVRTADETLLAEAPAARAR